MEPGRIEFIDDDGSTAAPERADGQSDVEPGSRRSRRWPVLVLVAVIAAVCGGVLWHQHASGAKHQAAAPVSAVGATGELLAEAERARARLLCVNQVRADLMSMSDAYRAAISAGGSVREAERAARAALADEPDGDVPGASYDAILRVWRTVESGLVRQKDNGASVDIALCP